MPHRRALPPRAARLRRRDARARRRVARARLGARRVFHRGRLRQPAHGLPRAAHGRACDGPEARRAELPAVSLVRCSPFVWSQHGITDGISVRVFLHYLLSIWRVAASFERRRLPSRRRDASSRRVVRPLPTPPNSARSARTLGSTPSRAEDVVTATLPSAGHAIGNSPAARATRRARRRRALLDRRSSRGSRSTS